VFTVITSIKQEAFSPKIILAVVNFEFLTNIEKCFADDIP